MKRIIPLAILIFLVGNSTKTTAANQKYSVAVTGDCYNSNPITFIENGITFFVYPNGVFDFNIQSVNYPNGYYFRHDNGKHLGNRRLVSYGMPIQYDNFGRVGSIGNVYIAYDCQNRVNQIGSIVMSYNQFALAQIGGLQLIYNYQGALINRIGAVVNVNINASYGTPYGSPYGNSCGSPYYNNNHYYQKGHFDHDDDYHGNFHRENQNYGNNRNDFPRGKGGSGHDRRG